MWGSWATLETEKKRRKEEEDEIERRRKGLSELITYLKKTNKDNSRRSQDHKVSTLSQRFSGCGCFVCMQRSWFMQDFLVVVCITGP